MSEREQMYELIAQLTPEREALMVKHLPFIVRGLKLEGAEFDFFLEALSIMIKKELGIKGGS